MTTWYFLFLLLCSCTFGTIIGAYFGTIEYRIRFDQKLITTRCYCPDCGHELTLFQQIPIVSWIALDGKCHYCGSAISIRYPLAEGGFLLVYGICFLLLYQKPLLLVCSWYLLVALCLLFRCHGKNYGLMKGLGIMLLYHLFFGLPIALILSIL